jgi:hypothetical protein
MHRDGEWSILMNAIGIVKRGIEPQWLWKTEICFLGRAWFAADVSRLDKILLA